MFGQWLVEHKDAVLDIYIGLRQERGDPRPAEEIRLAAGDGFDIMSQGFQGEAEWQDPAQATRRLLSAGIAVDLLAESSYLFFTAIRRVLAAEQPASGAEWLDELGEGLLRINQAMTLSLADTLQEQKSEFETLYRISRDLNTVGDTEELLQVLARPAIQAGAARITMLYVDLDEAGEPAWVEIAAAWRQDAQEPSAPVGTRYYLPEFPFSKLWLSSQSAPQIIGDVNTDERMDETTRSLLVQVGIQALVIIPLTQAGLRRELSEERRWVGIITFSWDEPHEFSAQEGEIYQALVGLATPAVQSRMLVDKLERIIEERTRELHAAEARNRQIIEDALVGIFRTSLEGQVIEANPTALKIFGCDSVQALNQVGLLNFYVDLSERDELIRLLHERGRVTDYQVNWRRQDGSTVRIELTARLAMDEQGQPAFIDGTMEDITQRLQVRAEREQLQRELIEAQQQAIQELSTPVIPIMDRILVMPLVGSIDSMRARHIMRALLEGIRMHRARIIILDITGVPIVDSGVANHLNKTIQAARLKGAQTIITGVSDAVAEAIVDLGIDWHQLETLSNLQSGLIVALDKLGIKLSKA
jgi:PAS domain S-box-containing protein